MAYETIFQRYELKYMLTQQQKKELLLRMQTYMAPDSFGASTICNIYFDTPDRRLIRRSMEKPTYKEKLRVRSYGVATHESTVFVEMKKKYDGVVYKRRLSLPEGSAFDYLLYDLPLCKESQISKELDYFRKLYGNLCPSVFLSYEREAYVSKTDKNFRMTFDENILARTDHLSLTQGVYGMTILPQGMVLLEVKTALGIPRWLLDFFGEKRLFKTPYSKYGKAYEQFVFPLETGGLSYAV